MTPDPRRQAIEAAKQAHFFHIAKGPTQAMEAAIDAYEAAMLTPICEAQQDPEAPAMTDQGLQIDWLGGCCPVQAYGTIDGIPFFFRSRGDKWSFGVGPEPVGDPEWKHIEPYGVWPDAGYIMTDEAEAFINKAVAIYRERKATP
jgi:hypothetical protein